MKALFLLPVVFAAGCAAPDQPVVNHFDEITPPGLRLPVTALEAPPVLAAGALAAPVTPRRYLVTVRWSCAAQTGLELAATPSGPWTVATNLPASTNPARLVTITTTNNPGFFRAFAR